MCPPARASRSNKHTRTRTSRPPPTSSNYLPARIRANRPWSRSEYEASHRYRCVDRRCYRGGSFLATKNEIPYFAGTSHVELITKKVGDTEGNYILQEVNADSIKIIRASAQKRNVEVFATVGDYLIEPSNYCGSISLKLVAVDYANQTASFENRSAEPPECVPAPVPVCLLGSSFIAGPGGSRQVKDVAKGSVVWTQDSTGQRVEATVLKVGRTTVPPEHRMVALKLNDGRELVVSPRHAIADGRLVGDLHEGDRVQGASVVSTDRIPNADGFTYDILPSGETRMYWADGILVRSTLR